MRLSFCLITAFSAAAPPAAAQFLVFEGVSVRDYVVLRQPQADHRITLNIRPVPGQGAAPQDVEWERWNPNGTDYTAQRRIEWFASASCTDGIQSLRIQGPGGTENQTLGGTRNAISGSTDYDSFDPDALDAICLDFARDATADCGEIPIGEPGCDVVDVFRFDANDPLPGSAPIRVGGQCSDGPLPERDYVPRLELTCRLAN
jgi:hypothetical protein